MRMALSDSMTSASALLALLQGPPLRNAAIYLYVLSVIYISWFLLLVFVFYY